MELSTRTKDILTNFAFIHPSLYIAPGNTLRVRSEGSSIFAEATTEETFPEEFRIYEIKNFLQHLNIIRDPKIEFQDGKAIISDETTELTYMGAHSELVTPEKKFRGYKEDPLVSFNLSKDELNSMLKFSEMLDERIITIRCVSGKVEVVCQDSHKSTNNFKISKGESDAEDFAVPYSTNLLRIIKDDYTVEVYPDRTVKLFTDDLYYIITEAPR